MIDSTSPQTVLVTGASGFIATHCIHQLLAQGYNVRGTLRTMAREIQLRQIYAANGASENRLAFVEANLLQDEGWDAAVNGCEFVLHVASPLPAELPKHEDELIVPAREGTLRVLKAAATSGVKRTVLTSSIASIIGGHEDYNKTFNEDDWSNTSGNMAAYPKSKTLAERSAWEFIKDQKHSKQMELAVINPGVVLGPLLDGTHIGASVQFIQKIMTGKYPGSARLSINLVDVRDVAAAHLAAMTNPNAANKRYCCVTDMLWMQEITVILKEHFADQGYKIRTRQMPDFMIRLFALFDAQAKTVVKNLGREAHISNARIIRDLNWQPYSAEEMIVATAQSMIDHNLI